MNHEPTKSDIVFYSKQLHARNLIASCDGNVSVRVDDDTILITPSGINKAFLQPKDIAVIDIDDKTVSGTPSSERGMHLEIYRRCKNAKAVVHAHPPTAIAWSIGKPNLKTLPSELMSELILALGEIPITPFAKPGTTEMANSLQTFLPKNRVMILGRHGGISWGESLAEAYNGMERLEHSAQILKSALEIANMSVEKLTALPEAELRWLREKRKELGERTL